MTPGGGGTTSNHVAAVAADVPDVLAAIVAATRRSVEDRRTLVSDAEIERRAWAAPSPRGGLFVEQLSRAGTVNIIAECKRRSPLKGVLRKRYDVSELARSYAAAGAAALSILTEPSFFDGALAHMACARAAVDLPLLRKDFIVDRYQLHEARCVGADAVLLIVSALESEMLRSLHQDAHDLGLAALVEVHTADELEVALRVGARVIGVNSRDLKTQRVDTQKSVEVLAGIPSSCIAVAESGLRSGADVARLRRAGFGAFLIGEAFMTSPDAGSALASLIEDAERELARAPAVPEGEP